MTEELKELREKFNNIIKEHPELPGKYLEAAFAEHLNMALYSKYPAVQVRHMKFLYDAIDQAETMQSYYNKLNGIVESESKIPRLNFKVK